MPPRNKPSSSHSSRPVSSGHSSRPSHGPSHSSSHGPSHSSSHRPPQHHSYGGSQHHGYGGPHHGYGAPPPPPHHNNSSGGFLTGMMVGSAMQQQNQPSVVQQTTVVQTAPQQPTLRKYNCPFCGGRVEGRPSTDGLQSMVCPNCGGALSEGDAIVEPTPQPVVQTVQTVQTPTYSNPAPRSTYRPTRTYRPGCHPLRSIGNFFSSLVKLVIFLVVLFVVCGIAFYINDKFSSNDNGHDDYYYEEYDDRPERHDPIYVPALGRDVAWDTEYETYYDRQTDCYFFLNTDMDPPIWQYWFEGVSSDYGSNYGWLEWDARENRWYVQTGSNTWQPLPEEKGSDLWHFD